jgi:hypothetical protein
METEQENECNGYLLADGSLSREEYFYRPVQRLGIRHGVTCSPDGVHRGRDARLGKWVTIADRTGTSGVPNHVSATTAGTRGLSHRSTTTPACRASWGTSSPTPRGPAAPRRFPYSHCERC